MNDPKANLICLRKVINYLPEQFDLCIEVLLQLKPDYIPKLPIS